MLNVSIISAYAECHFVVLHNHFCLCSDSSCTERVAMFSVIILSDKAPCLYAECHYAECHYADRHYCYSLYAES